MVENKEAELAIQRTRVFLMRNHPFFGYLAMRMVPTEVIGDDRVKTIGVNAKGTLVYNPDFIKGLDSKSLRFILCHEVMHLGLEHMKRLNRLMPSEEEIKTDEDAKELAGKIMHIQNTAADWAVNYLLDQSSLPFDYSQELPVVGSAKNAKCPKEYENKSFEEIMDELMKKVKTIKMPKKQACGNSSGPMGDSHERGNGSGSEEGEGDEKGSGSSGSVPGDDGNKSGGCSGTGQEIDGRRLMAEAMQYAKMQGKMPGYISQEIEASLQPASVNYRVLLHKAISDSIPRDHTWAKRRKSSYLIGVYLPRTKKEQVDVCVALDTSGSVSTQEYQKFLSEIMNIYLQFQGMVNLNVMLCDAEVQAVYKNETKMSTIIAKLGDCKGRGGTSFEPVRQYIADPANGIRCKVLIYFTDGMGDEFKQNTSYPVIWIITKNGISKGDGYWNLLSKTGRVIKIN